MRLLVGLLDRFLEWWTRLMVEAGSSQPPDDEDLFAGFVVVT